MCLAKEPQIAMIKHNLIMILVKIINLYKKQTELNLISSVCLQSETLSLNLMKVSFKILHF